MITQISFPITNSDSINFTSDINITNEEYVNMIVDNFERNKHMMNDFEKHGFSIKKNSYYGVDKKYRESEVNDFIDYSRCEALITKINGRNGSTEMTYDDINNIYNNGNMSLINVNINPNSVEFDAEYEIRMWVGESDAINSDKSLDNKTKFASLPKRDIRLYMENNDDYVLLNGCKIIQNNSDKNFPLNIIIIVEKITKD